MTTTTATEAADLYADGEGATGDTVGAWTLAGRVDEFQSRQSRWHERYWLVVRDANGDDWGIEYGLGLTEDQEHDFPWEDVPGDRTLPLTRLYPHTVTTVEYRAKPAEVSA